MNQENCPFCDVTKIKSEIIDYGSVMVFEPLNPVVPGHILVVPTVHIKDFTRNAQLSAQVMRIAAEVAKARGGDFNLITSKGRSATQTVEHLHIHLVPRKVDDGLKLPWSI